MNTFDGMKNGALNIVTDEKLTLMNVAQLLTPYQHLLGEDHRIILEELSSVNTGLSELTSIMTTFHKKAIMDPIGLHSRVYLDENIEAFAEEFNLAYLIGDVDKFGVYNTNYGHSQGDAALKTIANKFKESIENKIVKEERAFIARYGGEELCAFISPYYRSYQDLFQLAENVRSEIDNLKIEKALGINLPNEEGYKHVTITIAVGKRKKDESIQQFMHNIDRPLTKKDEGGRNRVYLREN